MKKQIKIISTLSLLTTLTLSSSLFQVYASTSYPINLVIDNHSVNVKNTIEPFMIDRVSYIPTDFLKSEFGVDVVTTNNNVSITTYDEKGNKTAIIFTAGSLQYTINGVEYSSETAPIIKNSKYSIPTRAIAPLFDMNFKYDDDSNTLTLNKNCYDKRLYQK